MTNRNIRAQSRIDPIWSARHLRTTSRGIQIPEAELDPQANPKEFARVSVVVLSTMFSVHVGDSMFERRVLTKGSPAEQKGLLILGDQRTSLEIPGQGGTFEIWKSDCNLLKIATVFAGRYGAQVTFSLANGWSTDLLRLKGLCEILQKSNP